MPGFGEALREARLNKGLSLEEAEKATRIRKKYLKALEDEDFSRLPDRIYLKGFTRIYAQYLGLSASDILRLLPKEPRRKPMQPLPKLPQPAPPIGSWLVGIAVIALMALGGFYLYNLQKEIIPPARGEVVLSPTPTATRTPTPRPLPTPIPTRPPSAEHTPSAVLTPVLTPTPKPQPVQVPSVIGMRYEDAARLMAQAQLTVSRSEDWHDTIPQGAVSRQSPAPGAWVPSRTAVSLMVSKGRQDTRIVVPNVVGMPEQQGIRVLREANLRVSPWINYQGHKDVPAKELERVSVGAVLSTTPGPGEKVEPETLIHIAVRRD